jgi:hypothetical protein
VEISGLGKFHTYSCLYHLLSTGQIEVAYAKPALEQSRMVDFSIKTFVTPMTIAVTVGILLLQFVVGTIIASKGWLKVNVFNSEVYEQPTEDYRKIFFYKLQRNPSAQEIEGLF